MDGTKISILKQPNKVGLGSFLEGKYGGALKSQLGLEILSYLSDESLKREFTDKEFSAFLVTSDFT